MPAQTMAREDAADDGATSPPGAPHDPLEGRFPQYEPHPDDELPAPMAIENARALDPYFRHLVLTDLQVAGAVTRTGHWGDSIIAGDGMTAAIRRRMQTRFGDAGHGFHAVGKYNRWYRHRGVRYEELRSWDTCEIIFKCRPDGRYGYAGVSSRSEGGARSRFETAKVSRFELWYARHPNGGKLSIEVDGELRRDLDTRSETHSDAVEAIRVDDGSHELVVTAAGGGVARTYGVVLEREGPGVVWDELSLIGSFTQRLDYQDAQHLAGQLQARDVHLMVFLLGGNDLSRGKRDLRYSTERYEREYARVLSKFKEGKRDAACLIMGTTDHGRRVGESIRSRPFVPRIVEAQRAVAMSEGCAFYDTFLAMGGAGSVGRWRRQRPPLVAPDLGHLTLAGQREVGGFLYAALMQSYAGYRRRNEGHPFPELGQRRRGQSSPVSEVEVDRGRGVLHAGGTD